MRASGYSLIVAAQSAMLFTKVRTGKGCDHLPLGEAETSNQALASISCRSRLCLISSSGKFHISPIAASFKHTGSQA